MSFTPTLLQKQVEYSKQSMFDSMSAVWCVRARQLVTQLTVAMSVTGNQRFNTRLGPLFML